MLREEKSQGMSGLWFWNTYSSAPRLRGWILLQRCSWASPTAWANPPPLDLGYHHHASLPRSALNKALMPWSDPQAFSALLDFTPKPRENGALLCKALFPLHLHAQLSVNELSTWAIPWEGHHVCICLPLTPTSEPVSGISQSVYSITGLALADTETWFMGES